MLIAGDEVYFPIINAVRERTRQVVAIPLAVASDVAGRGMWTSPVYQLGILANRPKILGLGIASQAASAGQVAGQPHIY